MLSTTGGEGKTPVSDKLHVHFDHVPVWQEVEKFAGEATEPYCVVRCCEVDKYAPALKLSLNSCVNKVI